MKKSLFICGVAALTLAGQAGAAVIINDDWTVNTPIPQGDPVGITTSQTFQNLSGSPISDVSVNLNISGGYNGGLYGYLTLQDAEGHTATEILLNEVGTTSANPFGSSGTGFNVTLSDSGTANGSIHNTDGVPTGTWQPDSTATLDGTFGGLAANGTWTLYLADLDTGSDTTGILNSWGLEVGVVPEPSQIGLVAGVGCLLVVGGTNLFRRSRQPVSGTTLA